MPCDATGPMTICKNKGVQVKDGKSCKFFLAGASKKRCLWFLPDYDGCWLYKCRDYFKAEK